MLSLLNATYASFLFTVPEGVLEPVLSAVSSSEIQIDWNTPQLPNGIIVSYTLYRITAGGGEMLVASFSEVGSYIVGDLEPFTEYVFLVEACTSVGCNRSDINSVITLESGKRMLNIIMLVAVHQVWPDVYCVLGKISSAASIVIFTM